MRLTTFVLLVLSLALCASGNPSRLQVEPAKVSPTTGKPLKWATNYAGSSIAYPSQHLEANLMQMTAADSLVYMFLTPNPEDSVKVDAMLNTFAPSSWNSIQKGLQGLQYVELFDRCAFGVIPVGKDGKIIVHVDSYRNKGMKHLNLVDANGTMLLRRPIWLE